MVLSVQVPERSDAKHYYACIYALSACRPLARSLTAAVPVYTFEFGIQRDSSARSRLLPETSSAVFRLTQASMLIALWRKVWLSDCSRSCFGKHTKRIVSSEPRGSGLMAMIGG